MKIQKLLYMPIMLIPLITSAQLTTAVDFGGNYGANNNSPLRPDAAPGVWVDETGDFNGNSTANDSRRYLPMNLTQAFIGFVDPLPGKNNTIHAGAQMTNFGTATSTGFNLFRYEGSANVLQANNHFGTASMGMAFAPNVRKNEFLNGAAAFSDVSFADQAGGFTGSFILTGAPLADGIQKGRLMVQAGLNWYVSESSVSGSGSLSVNPYNETWYLLDLEQNMLYDETAGGIPDLATSIVGSDLQDIQALGVHMINSHFNGEGANTHYLNTSEFSVAVVPEPSTVAIGFGISALLFVAFRRRMKRTS